MEAFPKLVELLQSDDQSDKSGADIWLELKGSSLFRELIDKIGTNDESDNAQVR